MLTLQLAIRLDSGGALYPHGPPLVDELKPSDLRYHRSATKRREHKIVYLTRIYKCVWKMLLLCQRQPSKNINLYCNTINSYKQTGTEIQELNTMQHCVDSFFYTDKHVTKCLRSFKPYTSYETGNIDALTTLCTNQWINNASPTIEIQRRTSIRQNKSIDEKEGSAIYPS